MFGALCALKRGELRGFRNFSTQSILHTVFLLVVLLDVCHVNISLCVSYKVDGIMNV